VLKVVCGKELLIRAPSSEEFKRFTEDRENTYDVDDQNVLQSTKMLK
jgi:hypothetical protein